MQIPSGWSGAELAGLGLGGTGASGGAALLRGSTGAIEPGSLAFEPGTISGGEGLGTPVAPNGYRPTGPQPGPTFRPSPTGPTTGPVRPGSTGGVLLSAMNPAIAVVFLEGESVLAPSIEQFGKDLEYWDNRISSTGKRFELVLNEPPSGGIDASIATLDSAASLAGEAEWACYQAARFFRQWESFWDDAGEPGLGAQAKATADEYDKKANLWAERRREQERKAAEQRRIQRLAREGPRRG